MKKSKRQIARELGIHRNTVTHCIEEPVESVRRYKRKTWSLPVLQGFTGVIDSWLEEDEQASRKQRHTAKRNYDRLQDEYEYTGSYGAVRDYVRQVKKQPREVFLPLAFEPGEMGQVDWIEDVTVVINGLPRKIQIFGRVLNYSGGIYFEAFDRAVQEAFFQGHCQCFHIFRWNSLDIDV